MGKEVWVADLDISGMFPPGSLGSADPLGAPLLFPKLYIEVANCQGLSLGSDTKGPSDLDKAICML